MINERELYQNRTTKLQICDKDKSLQYQLNKHKRNKNAQAYQLITQCRVLYPINKTYTYGINSVEPVSMYLYLFTMRINRTYEDKRSDIKTMRSLQNSCAKLKA